jgi:hypothetical protein
MVPLLIVPIFAGVRHASSSSAAKIYIDMDIPEKKIKVVSDAFYS